MRFEVSGLSDGLTFDLQSFKCDVSGAELGDVVVTDEDGNQIEVTKSKGKKNDFNFMGQDAGVYTVSVCVLKKVKLTPPVCKVKGSAVEGGDLRQSASFVILSGVSCGGHADKIDIHVEDPNGEEVTIGKLNDKRDGSYTGGMFKPKTPGIYRIEVNAFGKPAKGSPFDAVFQAAAVEKCFANGIGIEGGDEAQVGKVLDFTIHALDAEGTAVEEAPDAFKVTISPLDSLDVTVPCTIQDEGQGDFLVQWTPTEACPHKVEIMLYGRPLAVGPYTVDVLPPKPEPKPKRQGRKRTRSMSSSSAKSPSDRASHSASSGSEARSSSRSRSASLLRKRNASGEDSRGKKQAKPKPPSARGSRSPQRPSPGRRNPSREAPKGGQGRPRSSRDRVRSSQDPPAHRVPSRDRQRGAQDDLRNPPSAPPLIDGLHIDGLRESLPTVELGRLLERFGPVRSLDKKGMYAFVEFAYPEDNYKCLMAMHNTTLEGKVLRVEPRTRTPARMEDLLRLRPDLLPALFAAHGYPPLPAEFLDRRMPIVAPIPTPPGGGRRRSRSPRRSRSRRRSPGRLPPSAKKWRVGLEGLPSTLDWTELKDWVRSLHLEVDFAVMDNGIGIVELPDRQEYEKALHVLRSASYRGCRLRAADYYTMVDEKRRRTTGRERDRSANRGRDRDRDRSRGRDADRDRNRDRDGGRRHSRDRDLGQDRDRDREGDRGGLRPEWDRRDSVMDNKPIADPLPSGGEGGSGTA